MCGVGFGMGIERLLMVMQAAGVQIPKPSALKIFFCAMGPDARRRSFSLMQGAARRRNRRRYGS